MDNNSIVSFLIIFLVILTVWSLIWMIVGIILVIKNKELKIFGLTNVLWCLINLVISVVGILFLNSIYSRQDSSILQTLFYIVLINLFLDLIYIGAGLILRNKSSKLLLSIGNAVVIQGTFLVAFDFVLTVFLYSTVLG